MPSIYFINPASDAPTYFGGEVYAASGLPPTTLMADLAAPTLAALTPPGFRVRVCDENVTPVDLDAEVDFVGLTGKVTQWRRMRVLAEAFRRRGKPVIIGGPYASLCPDTVRPHCDILFRGEAETTAAELFADLDGGRWRTEYLGATPDLTDCPPPRWDLYPNDRAALGTVQTSRGCPFECEFCDVIQYLGRRQRHKPLPGVITELDALYRLGYRQIFLADDNFTVHRSRAKELLARLGDWNRAHHEGPVDFLTQVSIDAARDDELLGLCREAGLRRVFIGIESPNEDSLRETKKRQNLRFDLASQVERFLDHGISVTAGMIVGFDADGPDIFARQLEFATALPVPIFTVGALVAPPATPLHERLRRSGRLTADGSEVAATPWSTNIVPQRMDRTALLDGLRWLCRSLYEPEAFSERILRFIARIASAPRSPSLGGSFASRALRAVEVDTLKLLSRLPRLGPAEEAMWIAIRARLARAPAAADLVFPMLLQYLQIRHMYAVAGLWDLDQRGDSRRGFVEIPAAI